MRDKSQMKAIKQPATKSVSRRDTEVKNGYIPQQKYLDGDTVKTKGIEIKNA